jgi:hypothetical protein
MTWMGRPDEVKALGLLLDRTYAEVAAAAEQPRRLDREFLIGQFDLWDNHLLPAVAAAAAPLRVRRSAARAVWRRLGFRAGTSHRQWLHDHLAALGLEPETLLGPMPADLQPSPDHAGNLRAVPHRLTPESATLMLADYDLAGGDVEGARMEVVPTEPARVRGYLSLSASRRLYTQAAAPRPKLQFHCPDVTSFVFAHVERGTAPLDGQPAVVVTGDASSIDMPASGMDVRLAGRHLTYWPHDDLWHESAAARAAVPGAHDADPGLPELPDLFGPLDTLASLQVLITHKLRMMRYPALLRRWELAAAGAMCAGLGAETMRIASRLGPASRRAQAASHRLDKLIEPSEGSSRTFLRGVTRHLSLDVPAASGPPPPAPVRITIGTAGRLLDDLDFSDGRLRFVDVSVDHRPGRADETILHLDARRGGRDTIVVVVLKEPLGCAPLTVTPDGLALAGRPGIDANADDVALTIPLPGGDWTVRAGAGSWYVD